MEDGSQPTETIPETGISEIDSVIELVNRELLALERFNLASIAKNLKMDIYCRQPPRQTDLNRLAGIVIGARIATLDHSEKFDERKTKLPPFALTPDRKKAQEKIRMMKNRKQFNE